MGLFFSSRAAFGLIVSADIEYFTYFFTRLFDAAHEIALAFMMQCARFRMRHIGLFSIEHM